MLQFTNISYYKCQSCASRVNCHICDGDLMGEIQKAGAGEVSVNMLAKQISLDPAGLSEDDVIDILEDLGIFV